MTYYTPTWYMWHRPDGTITGHALHRVDVPLVALGTVRDVLFGGPCTYVQAADYEAAIIAARAVFDAEGQQ